MAAADGPILELEGIGKSFGGGVAPDGVDFALAAGEVHGLVGENGAGKSTLMKIISGVHTDYTGAMRLAGAPVRFRSTRDALAAGGRGELKLVFPTIKHLEQIAPFASADALLAGARGRVVEPVEPTIVMEGEVARVLGLRFVHASMRSGDPPRTEASEYKLFATELSKRLADESMDIGGPGATLRVGTADAPMAGRAESTYRYTVIDTIGGGTSEVQKNIIATRKLGLPKNF